jgi:putative nucleotidyltransferase with HDIG domain
MVESTSRSQALEELVRRFASTVRGAQLYQPGHPLIQRNIEGLLAALQTFQEGGAPATIGLVYNQVVVAGTPMPRASTLMGDLIGRLHRHGIERITFDAGVTAEEVARFAAAIGSLPPQRAPDAPSPAASWTFTHIHLGRIAADRQTQDPRDGIASDIEAIRTLYQQAVTLSEQSWGAAATEGIPDADAAKQVVDGLAEAVTENRTALVALTAMRTYDNYTFTHMVNVSILTMGQARALGIEGRLLREFGLSALMHDIGKVRTPKEILNKPGKLTDDEFAIMKRHTVDGAEILRRTPEMPILAPVVAFEHHLRRDGTGYPDGAERPNLNLGTMLCSIADVYDAMRSQRAYQQAFPSDRILAVLQRNDGTQFDQHLVRRFSQLMGIYPPGNLVRLGSGEIAIVVHVHAPDPYRPKVKVLYNAQGLALDQPVERNLWEPREEGGTLDQVVSPVDPSEYGIDPLTYL